MRLADKVALITGGGSGIGRATALLFAEEGARVVVSDINQARTGETADEIKSRGGEASKAVGDVTLDGDTSRMVQTAVDAYGRLDVLVNSAGITARNALGPDASPEQVWDRVIEVNLKGTYLVSSHALPEMERVGGGAIVNLASIFGLVGYHTDVVGKASGLHPYAPSKGGVVQLTRNLGIAYAKDNIRVNCICPGYLTTPLTDALTADPAILETLERAHPMGRLGRPEEVAYAALYLASDESSFVTGAVLAVDGGYTAQ